MKEPERDIAADAGAGTLAHPVKDRRGQQPYRRNRRRPEGDADEEKDKAAGRAAQLTNGEAKGQQGSIL